jgi:hypothetical protein
MPGFFGSGNYRILVAVRAHCYGQILRSECFQFGLDQLEHFFSIKTLPLTSRFSLKPA